MHDTFIQDFRCKRHYSDQKPCSGAKVFIPGRSGIPEWISHKSMGCEITIEIPKNWYEDDSFLGFALFFHHVPLDDDDDEYDHKNHGFPQCELSMISHGDHSEPVGSIRLRAHCKTYRNYGSLKLNEPCQFSCYDNGSTSDPALWVSYFPLIAISKKYRSSRWNYFKAHFNKSVKRSFDCGKKNAFKLKSCGIHPIYMGSRSSSTESESQPIY